MSKIKKIIILLVVILVVIIIILASIFILKKDNIPIENIVEPTIQNPIEEKQSKITEIDNIEEYMNIKECINKYISYSTNLKNTEEKSDEEREQAIKVFKSIIPEFIIEELNINDEDLYNKIGIKDKIFKIEKAYKSMQTENTAIYEYLVEGKLIDKQTLEQEEFKIIIILDKINGTFLVIPEQYLEQKNIEISEDNNISIYEEENIKDERNNRFDNDTPTREEICESYFLEFKDYAKYDIEFIYNLLDEEYSQKRFRNIDDFKTFVTNDINNKNDRRLNKYNVEKGETNKYTCRDQYGNTYIFYEKKPLNYTIILDTYTIDLPEFTKTYESANEERKVTLNIGKIMEAVNYADYRYVYKRLQSEFQVNNFNNLNEFEEFAKEKFFNKNEINDFQYKKEGNSYICYLKLKNEENSEEFKTVILIMNLLDNTNFEISFSM